MKTPVLVASCILLVTAAISDNVIAQGDDDLLSLIPSILSGVNRNNLGCEVSAEMSELIRLHNTARQNGVSCGGQAKPSAGKLVWSCKLIDAASGHSQDMSSNGFLSHRGSNGSTLSSRVNATGFAWAGLGENIAQGHRSSSAVNQGWLSSSGHCNNIMNGSYTHMGAARVGNYWTTVFAREQ